MSSLFPNNVLGFLDNQLKKETELPDKRKIQNLSHYCKMLAKAENKFIRQTDFSVFLEGIFPEELLKFTDEQKKELDDFAYWISSPEEFAVYLQLLGKAVDDYRNSEDTVNPIYSAIQQTYDYMLLRLKKKYPSMHNKYLILKREKQAKTEEKQSRPRCPECRSNHIMSCGVNWRCSECGKYFVKNPRRQKS